MRSAPLSSVIKLWSNYEKYLKKSKCKPSPQPDPQTQNLAKSFIGSHTVGVSGLPRDRFYRSWHPLFQILRRPSGCPGAQGISTQHHLQGVLRHGRIDRRIFYWKTNHGWVRFSRKKPATIQKRLCRPGSYHNVKTVLWEIKMRLTIKSWKANPIARKNGKPFMKSVMISIHPKRTSPLGWIWSIWRKADFKYSF